MSRQVLLSMLAIVVLGAGCQTTPKKPAATQKVDAERQYEAVAASALVFDPPVALNEPPLALSRADREARVSVGYEELTTEYFYIRLDDRQTSYGFDGRGHGGGNGSYDQYERRAITERSGVRYR